MFSDGVEGFYWSLDDPAAGAKKLIALMEDKETYNKMAEAAKARFSANFQSSVVANRLLSFLCNQAFPNSGF
jgi:glycosyltransferase involved in cell wall biosynthesis